jgi:trafficking protein particle complex subunit 2
MIDELLAKNIIEPFLGMLHPTENFHVFGYMSNTDTKLIAVVDENDAKDQDPKVFLEALHNLYLNTISNPFYVMGTPIRSNYFETEIAKLIVAGAS